MHTQQWQGGQGSDADDKLLDELCTYKLRCREPFLAIGGDCLLDIAGIAACLYRHSVPFVHVPTRLRAIVNASVGFKNSVEYLQELCWIIKNGGVSNCGRSNIKWRQQTKYLQQQRQD
eukprot:14122517-Ditylum_brightwellii.AAC.1